MKSDKILIKALELIADIRNAVGDPTGKLMQDDLIKHCQQMREALLTFDKIMKKEEEPFNQIVELLEVWDMVKRTLTLQKFPICDNDSFKA